jgi:hypothetical protein
MFRSAPTQLVIGIPRAFALMLLLPLLVLMWRRRW